MMTDRIPQTLAGQARAVIDAWKSHPRGTLRSEIDRLDRLIEAMDETLRRDRAFPEAIAAMTPALHGAEIERLAQLERLGAARCLLATWDHPPGESAADALSGVEVEVEALRAVLGKLQDDD